MVAVGTGEEGKGSTVRYGIHRSPFGRVFLAATERGVCALKFLRGGSTGRQEAEALRRSWKGARVVPDRKGTLPVAQRIFAPPREAGVPPPAVVLKGTAFQVTVWKALLRIPAGYVLSYEDVALLAGFPRSARAVGGAVARNPVSILVPCHRVIRKTGESGNYGGGRARKRALLAAEAVLRAGV